MSDWNSAFGFLRTTRWPHASAPRLLLPFASIRWRLIWWCTESMIEEMFLLSASVMATKTGKRLPTEPVGWFDAQVSFRGAFWPISWPLFHGCRAGEFIGNLLTGFPMMRFPGNVIRYLPSLIRNCIKPAGAKVLFFFPVFFLRFENNIFFRSSSMSAEQRLETPGDAACAVLAAVWAAEAGAPLEARYVPEIVAQFQNGWIPAISRRR